MTLFKCVISVTFIYASCCYSQITLSGRFVQPNETNFDSATVVIKEPTADTVYARTRVSTDGSFSLKTNNSGTFMAEFRHPHYYPLKVALIVDEPTEANIDVTLRSKSDPHYNCKFAFRDSLSLLARFAVLHFNISHIQDRFARPTPVVDQIDWKKELQFVESTLAKETEPLLRQELIIQCDEVYAGISPLPDSLKKRILEIPPTSPVWVYHFNEAYLLPMEYL